MIDQVLPCYERYGLVRRRVLEVQANQPVEDYLRARIPPPPYSPMKDLDNIYSIGSRLFLVDDVGMLYSGILEFEDMLDVHVCFWDRILNGREHLCHTLATQVATEAGRPGVWTAIPESARTILAFAHRAGFTVGRVAGSAVLMKFLIT